MGAIMRGPCMCGDIYCYSCGPAQGNYKCDICGLWSEDGGCLNPDECARKSAEQTAAMVKEWEESEGSILKYGTYCLL